LPAAERQPLIEKLLVVYENEPDAGLHGAVEWLLRRWGQEKRLEAVIEELKSDEKQLQVRKSTNKRQWYVNTQKQTFVIVDAGEFLMGSAETEPDHLPQESQHRCRIGRRFAISAHEVTKAQWRAFRLGRHIPDAPEMTRSDIIVRTDDSPQPATWYAAAYYCNWLSEQEGISKEQWCYETNKQGKYGPGMKAKDRFWELTGYRLPTEAEWEYACRSGTLTSRYYGLTETLLPDYAWFQANGQDRTWPVGSLKPNDLGLFDMHGNVWQWCQDWYGDYPKNDVIDPIGPEKGESRVLRGGSWFEFHGMCRSAVRARGVPSGGLNDCGLRVCFCPE